MYDVFFSIMLFCTFCKFSINECFIRNTRFEFTWGLKNIEKQIEAVFWKYSVIFPGILLLVAVNYLYKVFEPGLRKLWCDNCGNFFRRVRIYIVNTLLYCICKWLYYLRVIFNITFFCTVCSVWYISALNAKRAYNVTGTFVFQKCRMRLKLNCVSNFSVPTNL